MRRLSSVLLFLLLTLSAFAFVAPSNNLHTQEAHAASPNWKPFSSCLNNHATCLDIIGPASLFQGLPNLNQTTHYVFTNIGIDFWYNIKGNFSVPYFRAQWGSLSSPCLLLPSGVPVVVNASTISQSFKQSPFCGSNTVSLIVYYKQQISNGYVSLDLKQAIQHSFSSYPATLNEVFLNPLNAHVTYDSAKHQILFGGVGYDWSDSPSGVFNLSSNMLSWNLSASGVIDPATVGTSTVANAIRFDDQPKECQANGYHVVFRSDGTNMGYQTSSDGTTWHAFQTVAADVDGADFAIACSGNSIAYVRATATGFAERDGTPGNPAITWGPAERTQATTHGSTSNSRPTIVWDASGNLIVSISTYDGTTRYLEVWKFSINSWSDISPSVSGGGNIYDSQMVFLSTTNVAVVYQVTGSTSAICDKRYTGSWSSAACTSSTSYSAVNGEASHLGSTIVICETISSGSAGNVDFLSETAGTWSSAKTIASGGAFSFAECGIGTDNSKGVAVMAAISSTEVGYYSSSDSGSTWSAKTDFSTTETNANTNGMTADPDLISSVFDGIWMSGSVSPFSVRFATATITFTTSDTITLTVAPVGGTQATLALSGGSVSPTSVLGDGTSKAITCATGNPTVTVTVPADGATTVYRFATLSKTATFTCDGTGHSFTYYYMDIITYQYTVKGGGTPTAPTLTGTALGATTTVTAPSVSAATTYLDHGTSYSLTNPTTGSSSTERWDTTSASGTSSGGLAIDPNYYHQYLTTASYSGTVAASGAPTFSSTAFGSITTLTMPSVSPSTIWVDNTASYSTTKPTADFPSATERYDTGIANGTISAALTLAPVFYHQYLVTNPDSLSMSPTQFGAVAAAVTANAFNDNNAALSVAATFTCSFTVANPSYVYQFSPSGVQAFTDSAISSLQDFSTSNPPYINFVGTNTNAVLCVKSSSLNSTPNKVTVSGSSISFTWVNPLLTFKGTGTSVPFEVDWNGGSSPTPSPGGGGGTYISSTTTTVTSSGPPVPASGNEALIPTGLGVLTFIFLGLGAFLFVRDRHDIRGGGSSGKNYTAGGGRKRWFTIRIGRGKNYTEKRKRTF